MYERVFQCLYWLYVNEESKESPVKTLYITMTSLNFPDILHVMGNISLKGQPCMRRGVGVMRNSMGIRF